MGWAGMVRFGSALLALTVPVYFSLVVPPLFSPFYPDSTENLHL